MNHKILQTYNVLRALVFLVAADDHRQAPAAGQAAAAAARTSMLVVYCTAPNVWL